MKISVCMATYNGGKFIKAQISSILNQKFHNPDDVLTELIISDDGSTDDTLSIINGFDDARIKVYHHRATKRHEYFTSAFACTENFNNAVSKATGDYIFLSDQDDVWYEWKIAHALDKFWGGNMM